MKQFDRNKDTKYSGILYSAEKKMNFTLFPEKKPGNSADFFFFIETQIIFNKVTNKLQLYGIKNARF